MARPVSPAMGESIARYPKRRLFSRNLLVLLISIATASSTLASLTVDLRAVSTTSGSVLDAKDVSFAGGVGDSVRLNVVATVTGVNSNPNDDFIQIVHGSFLSSFGGLHGDLVASPVFPFNYTVLSYGGTMQDLDGDGDLDVGSNDDSTLSNFFRSYFGGDNDPQAEAVIAVLIWTYSGSGGTTSLNFRPRNVDDGGRWFMDGIGQSPVTDSFLAGDAVRLTFVPEPIAISLVPLGFGTYCRWHRLPKQIKGSP
jgi:hypothetical protein